MPINGFTESNYYDLWFKGINGELQDMYYRKVYLDAYILSKIIEKIKKTDISKMVTFGKRKFKIYAF